MASDIIPSTDSFSKTSMKPDANDEAVALWAQKVAANTGYLAGLQRIVISGDINLQIPGAESQWTFYSIHCGYVDTERHKGTLEIRTPNLSIAEMKFWVGGIGDGGGTSIYDETTGFTAGSVYCVGIADLSSYVNGSEGTLVGTFSIHNVSDVAVIGASFDLYSYA